MLTKYETKAGRPMPHNCPAKSGHTPGVKCGTCGGTPPLGRALSDTPDEPYELRWGTWYATYTPEPDPETVTPIEQREAIAKATEEYQEACARLDQVRIEWLRSEHDVQLAEQGFTTEMWEKARASDETVRLGGLKSDPAKIERAKKIRAERARELEEAEAAATAAMRRKNEISQWRGSAGWNADRPTRFAIFGR